MPDILQRVGIKSTSLYDAYKALTTAEGLAGWWTTDTKGEGNKTGGIVKFRFADAGIVDVKVVVLQPDKQVVWEVIDGPPEWIGTTISFDLRLEGDYIIVLVKHEGWKEAVEFMHHCTTKWAIFLMSFKSLVETGKGAPFPNDVKIDNWN